MADEMTTPATTDQTSTATPPTSPQTTPGSTDTIREGHVDAKDFAHPEYGTKLKNLYDGFQEKSQKLSAAEKRALEAETKYRQTEEFLRDPANAPKIRAWLNTTHPEKPAVDPNNETDDERIARIAKETASSDVATNMAMWELFSKIGNGDVNKGRERYFAPDEKTGRTIQREMDDLLDRFIKGDPRDMAALAYELVQARRPQPAPEAPGTTRTEGGHGSSESPAGPSVIRNAEEALAAAGYSSETEYLRALKRM